MLIGEREREVQRLTLCLIFEAGSLTGPDQDQLGLRAGVTSVCCHAWLLHGGGVAVRGGGGRGEGNGGWGRGELGFSFLGSKQFTG